MRVEQVSCDVCGKQKQQSNHWFVIVKATLQIIIVAPINVPHIGSVEGECELLDLCGESCVLRKVSELIGAPYKVDVVA